LGSHPILIFPKTEPGRYSVTNQKKIKPIDYGELKLNFVRPGAWTWKLPISFKSNYSIELEITDENNQTWLVYEKPNITLTAKKKEGGKK
jgi:hypothetical protein